MSQNRPAGDSPAADDPNSSVAGARQRKGPFWVEEPGWFRLVAITTFLLGLALFLIAVGFDRP